jgi:hypothetical protein
MDSSSFFREAGQHPLEAKKPAQDLSLYLDDIIAARKKEIAAEGLAETDSANKTIPPFSITNPAYENQRLQADPEWKGMNEERKNDVLHDPYIIVAYQLVAPLMK